MTKRLTELMKRLENREGSAIATVICFVGLLLILITSLIQTSTNSRFAVKKGLPPLQAKLIALSGVQHMLLKSKIAPAELYDAWALSKGRNPFFNFYIARDKVTNPGPRFVTKGTVDGSDPNNKISIDTADNFSNDTGRNWFTADPFTTGWPKWKDAASTPVPNSQIYLWKFIADVTNDPAIQPALVVATSTPATQPKPYWGTDPFMGIYRVTKVDIMGQRDRRGYYEDTISFEVEGKIVDGFGFTCTEKVTSIVHVARR